MTEFGYFLSSEEHGPRALLEQAKMAEAAGMEKVAISDHFHPWMESQGQSPFVWTTIGAIAAATEEMLTRDLTRSGTLAMILASLPTKVGITPPERVAPHGTIPPGSR